MPPTSLRWLVVALFGAGAGYYFGNACGPPVATPEYYAGGAVTVMSHPGEDTKQLYLRRKLFLSQRPRHAWIQVLARDQVQLLVNGGLVAQQALDGCDVGVLADVTPHLKLGRNIIAVIARQTSAGSPPQVAVDGRYLLTDGDHPLQSDGDWRCRTVFERGARWWFEADFVDVAWPFVRLSSSYLRPRVPFPPRSVMAVPTGHWIGSSDLNARAVVIRRCFEIKDGSRSAWMRIAATSPYRLAVNGIPLDRQEASLGTPAVTLPVVRTYDLTAALRNGENVLSLLAEDAVAAPRFRADLEVEGATGEILRFGTDGRWLVRPGRGPGWAETSPASSVGWEPCQVSAGDAGIPPWLLSNRVIELSLPWSFLLLRYLPWISLMILVGLTTYRLCRLVERAFRHLYPGHPDASGAVPYLSLLLPALGFAGAFLATFDHRIPRQDLFRPEWFALALGSVPAQWALLGVAELCKPRAAGEGLADRLRFASTEYSVAAEGFRNRLGGRGSAQAVSPSEARTESRPPESRPRFPRWGTERLAVVGVLLLTALGFWIRLHYLQAEPLHHDEVMHYALARGVWERGIPSLQVHENTARRYLYTSELMHYCMAAASLVFRDILLTARVPALIWGTLTIPLIFACGRNLFGTSTGMTAATLYTLAPHCIQMANYGRYPSQMQFFTLLTASLLWLAIRGDGPVNLKAVWAAAASFVCLYLSWEGTALVAPGLALAALVDRRRSLSRLVGEPSVWVAGMVVGALVLLHLCLRTLALTGHFLYGMGHKDFVLAPAWTYPLFDPLFYIRAASWNRDLLLPMLGLAGGILLSLGHRDSRPAGFLTVIFLGTCMLMTFFFPAKTWRYGYHLMPFSILLASACLVAAAQAVAVPPPPATPILLRSYRTAVSSAIVLGLVLLGSGLTLQMTALTSFRSSANYEAYGLDLLKNPDHAAALRYVTDHLQEGDVVMSHLPLLTDHFLGARSDYWLQERLFVPPVLDNVHLILRHPYAGTVTVPSRDSLKSVFARHRRVWYITVPWRHGRVNGRVTSDFLREQMDVVYENFCLVVLLRDAQRPASLRQKNADALFKADVNFLP